MLFHSEMKDLTIFTVIFSLLFLTHLTNAYWYESISVYVLSKDGLPIQNATVSVVYQSTDCNTYSEIKKQTNSNGTANFSFMNLVDETFNPVCLDRTYKIYADFGGYSNSTIGYVNRTDKKYKLWLPFIMHTINIVDATNKPIYNASAIFTKTSSYSYSDDSGNAYLILPVGMSSVVTVSYGNVSKTISVNPSLSIRSNVSLQIYDLKVSLTDENGNILYGTISYDSTHKILNNSYVVFQKFSNLNPTFQVNVNNVTRSISAQVISDSLILRYDTTPPLITNVNTYVTGNKLVISASFLDPGKYASGIHSSPIILYSINASEQKEVRMYPLGSGKFEGSVPITSLDDINYTIIINDLQGNQNSYSDVYTVQFKPEVEIVKATKSFSWITAIGIFIFAIVVFLVYQKIKEQAG